jgi:hypothetical protein
MELPLLRIGEVEVSLSEEGPIAGVSGLGGRLTSEQGLRGFGLSAGRCRSHWLEEGVETT